MSAKLQSEPIQTSTDPRNFPIDYRGAKYVIQPMADYEITGLVVSKNNINAFDDIYHTADSVDVQDLCMVWGNNADNEILAGLSFYSEPFSCHFKIIDDSIAGDVNFDQVSNTHILSEDESIRRRIRKVGVGDQITLKGRLVNYFPAGASEAVRKTSLRRNDTGNGACEVMLVDSFETISAPLESWRTAFRTISKTLFGLVLIKLCLILFLPYWEYKAMR